MKAFVLCCILFCMWQITRAQNTLSGLVVHKENKAPLVGATVFLPDLNIRVQTDTAGMYSFTHLPKGRFLIECKKTEHLTITQYVNINSETKLDFALADEVVEVDEVIVTGSAQSSSLRDNPMPITTINHNTLLQKSATNLIDNVSSDVAVNQLATGAGIGKPVIRGLSYNRIVSLNNGIRQEGQQWGDEHGIEIDEYAVDRVEIIKGPGSLMYGSDAIGGVIHFLPEYPVPLGKLNTEFLANYQSNNQLQAYSLRNAGNTKGVYWNIRGTYKRAGNYKNAYDGYVMNSGFEEKNGTATLGINRKWGLSQVYCSNFNQLVGMTEGERDSLGQFILERPINDTLTETISYTDASLKGFHMQLPQQSINHFKIGNLTRVFFGGTNVSLNIAYQRNKRKELANFFDPTEPEIFFDMQTLNYDVRFNFKEAKGWSISTGLNGMRQQSRNLAEEVIIPEYTLTDIGVYVFAKKAITKKIHVAGGLRLDNRWLLSNALYIDTADVLQQQPSAFTDIKFEALHKTFTALTGSAGLSYFVTDKTVIKFNVARGYRAPNMAELASNGKHEGTLRYEIGNSHLKPETTFQTDFGVLLNATHVSVETALFFNSIQQYVYLVKLPSVTGADSIPDSADPVPAFRYTAGHAILYGGEVAVDVHPHPLDWLHIENAFALAHGVLRNQPDSMMHLPFMPPMRYKAELRCAFNKKKTVFQEAYAAIGYHYFFAQDKIFSAYNTETETPAYGLVNVSVGFEVVDKRKSKTYAAFHISVNNLLNTAYQSHLSRLKYAAENIQTQRMGVYNMGRNVSVKLIIPINYTFK